MKTLIPVLAFLAIPAHAELPWHAWSPDVFAQAQREHRFVLLDLEAVWCHWCHVMDQTTYRDAATVALLESKYLLVRVDQDSRPDLSNRYEDYGWPATVVFDANGQEIVKRRGYIPPREMASMLQAIIDDPTPGPSVEAEAKVEFAANSSLPEDLRARLEAKYLAGYDSKFGSWGFDQKYLDWDGVEYALGLARKGDARAAAMAQKTLEGQLNLIDPVWGGVYQYSTGGNWKSPHFEKIMQMQAENLRIYSLAYAQNHDAGWLKAALDIHRFLTTFLKSPEGAFYTSQDADVIDGQHSAHYFKLNDAARRRIGVPRVDRHIYSRENGWAIAALAALYQASPDPSYLDEAKRAAEWVIANRSLRGGGFRHDSQDASGPYLGDTLSMARGFVALYTSTGDRAWLRRSEEAMKFAAANFKNPGGAGFVAATSATDFAYHPHPEFDENVALVRVANLVAHYDPNPEMRAMAEEALRYVVTPQIAQGHSAVPTLLAASELATPPIHLTIVGHKDDPAAKLLFAAALAYPTGYKMVEWWDKREGSLPNNEIDYPELAQAAAFVCTAKSCSSPILDAAKLIQKAEKVDR